jgi:hypothetical protein
VIAVLDGDRDLHLHRRTALTRHLLRFADGEVPATLCLCEG